MVMVVVMGVVEWLLVVVAVDDCGEGSFGFDGGDGMN